MLQEYLKKKTLNKKTLILGFGQEGKSTYEYIRKVLPDKKIYIADSNSNINFPKDINCKVISGKNYLENIDSFDIIFKTPGISLKDLNIAKDKIVSQTGIFLELYKNQIIGITGTKGKSTTASLIYHIIKQHTQNVILTGNIGTPAFDSITSINKNTIIVVELSSHQLEYVKHSPNIAILLNIFQEHLDHYNSFEDYQKAKLRITRFQNKKDTFIYSYDDQIISKYLHELPESIRVPISIKTKIDNGAYYSDKKFILNSLQIPFSNIVPKSKLKGKHNYYNMLAAIAACKLKSIPNNIIISGIESYKGLEHRLEFVGNFQGIEFYNDSIATIPEATIAALEALKDVSTLILGGHDRGIDYRALIKHLKKSSIGNIILLGDAGKTIEVLIKNSGMNTTKIIAAQTMKEVVDLAFKLTPRGTICLLSPAAASYGMFKNFKERGEKFRHLVESHPNA